MVQMLLSHAGSTFVTLYFMIRTINTFGPQGKKRSKVKKKIRKTHKWWKQA